jgi:SAM-dependent methyltransferase
VKITTDWRTHLHDIRTQEIELIFSGCPPRAFGEGLELGAGDGFQSALLSRYVAHLTSTDYDPAIRSLPSSPSVTYQVGDAEEVDKAFPASHFDLVFSSNLLEHVPDPVKTLRGVAAVLKDEGITIHVIPNVFWKLSSIALYIPYRFATRMERMTQPTRVQEGGHQPVNNPKTPRPRRSFLARQLWPEPHGVSKTNREELRAFSLSRWREAFEGAGLRVITIRRGPVASGYGFGFDALRTALRRLGLCSEYVYVAAKAGRTSPYETLFRSAGAGPFRRAGRRS